METTGYRGIGDEAKTADPNSLWDKGIMIG